MPSAEDVDPLVVLEDVLVVLHISWLHWFQVADDVPSVVSLEGGRGMEPVIVPRREVNHHVLKCVASVLNLLQKVLNATVSAGG